MDLSKVISARGNSQSSTEIGGPQEKGERKSAEKAVSCSE